MTNITLKNIPEDIYLMIKERAKRNRRSINSEIIFILENRVMTRKMDPEKYLARVEALHNELSLPPLTDDILDQARNEGRP